MKHGRRVVIATITCGIQGKFGEKVSDWGYIAAGLLTGYTGFDEQSNSKWCGGVEPPTTSWHHGTTGKSTNKASSCKRCKITWCV